MSPDYTKSKDDLWKYLMGNPDVFYFMGKRYIKHDTPQEVIDLPATPTGQIIININLNKENK